MTTEGKSSVERELSRRLASLAPILRKRFVVPDDLRAVLSVDDLVQETFVAAFVAVDRMPEDEGEAVRWLGRIARNVLLDAVRSLRARKRGGGFRAASPQSRGESLFGAELQTPSRHVRRDEGAVRLQRAAGALAEPYRTAALSLIAGESVAVLAERLGKTPGAVHMLLTRTRRLLRAELGGEAGDYLESR